MIFEGPKQIICMLFLGAVFVNFYLKISSKCDFVQLNQTNHMAHPENLEHQNKLIFQRTCSKVIINLR